MVRPYASPVPFEEELLSRRYVARWLGVDSDTLYNWEHLKKGPPVTRLGRHCKYIRRDVRAWLEKQQTPGAAAKPQSTRKASTTPKAKPKPARRAAPKALES